MNPDSKEERKGKKTGEEGEAKKEAEERRGMNYLSHQNYLGWLEGMAQWYNIG